MFWYGVSLQAQSITHKIKPIKSLHNCSSIKQALLFSLCVRTFRRRANNSSFQLYRGFPKNKKNNFFNMGGPGLYQLNNQRLISSELLPRQTRVFSPSFSAPITSQRRWSCYQTASMTCVTDLVCLSHLGAARQIDHRLWSRPTRASLTSVLDKQVGVPCLLAFSS